MSWWVLALWALIWMSVGASVMSIIYELWLRNMIRVGRFFKTPRTDPRTNDWPVED